MADHRTDDPREDPVRVVRDILAGGPVPVPEFRRLARERGVPVKAINKAAKEAGAECRRDTRRPGVGGWYWALTRPPDDGIITRPNRRGYYAHVYEAGKEVQKKLGDTIEEARANMAALRERLDQEAREAPPRPAPREKKPEQPPHVQLRDVARQVLKLARAVEHLATADPRPQPEGASP